MAYRHRALEARLKKYLGLFPAIAVTGPRQSGKSTLLQTAFPDLPYVSFDDPEEVAVAGQVAEASDCNGNESKIAKRRARTVPFGLLGRRHLKDESLTVSSINGMDNRVDLPVARSSPAVVPLLDEVRTYCYEHQIEEIPALLAV